MFWQNATQRVYQGDTLALLDRVVPDRSIPLIFLDPPYNLGKQFGGFKEAWQSEQAYLEWAYGWLEVVLRKLSPQGSLYLMASTQMMPYFDLYLRERLEIMGRIVWAYDSSGVQARKRYGSLYEPILWAVKDPRHYTFNAEAIQVEARTGAQRRLIDYRKDPPQPYNSLKVPGNVWQIPRVRYRMPEYVKHPSQKPIALLERIIKASSMPGETVLDPFAGSFSTAFVAQSLGRCAISIEREPEYVQQGLQRLGLTDSDRLSLTGENL